MQPASRRKWLAEPTVTLTAAFQSRLAVTSMNKIEHLNTSICESVLIYFYKMNLFMHHLDNFFKKLEFDD